MNAQFLCGYCCYHWQLHISNPVGSMETLITGCHILNLFYYTLNYAIQILYWLL
jgi:hypothetical protein